MKNIIFISVIAIGLISCSNDSSESNTPTHPTEVTKNNTVEEVIIQANTIMKMEVEGMVCKMGCGGSIRKGLKETNGVSKVEFDFDEERLVNFAKIYFDNEIVSEEELIKVVSTLNDNQFTIGKTETKQVSSSDRANPSNSEAGSDITIESCTRDNYSQGIELPNLLNFLSRLFT